jgi:hypothetical protein
MQKPCRAFPAGLYFDSFLRLIQTISDIKHTEINEYHALAAHFLSA